MFIYHYNKRNTQYVPVKTNFIKPKITRLCSETDILKLEINERLHPGRPYLYHDKYNDNKKQCLNEQRGR